MPSIASFFWIRGAVRPQTSDGDSKKTKVKRRRILFMDKTGFRDFLRRYTSFHSNAKGARRSGAALADVPDLPSLPIYQTFTSIDHSINHVVSTGGERAQMNHATSLASASSAAEKPAVNDRAVELAEVYRSILPDFGEVGSCRLVS
ncbi:hypothetical protein N656DRAFT_357687 [Canariomyces notabilis]|uniref:Uncharacterized protein n=1 Tax=Canariomyces notabilis TaxID=2074819 RepID=A0AAN6QLD8_9PEZI|nr:hypothetical protein N656DRAFT_357687 [Canariomyces arenarius]